MERRSFLAGIGAGFSALALPAASAPVTTDAALSQPDKAVSDRASWVSSLLRIVAPVLATGAAGTLKTAMPVEAAAGQQAGRRNVTHLEALGRTLAGLAP